MQDRDIKLGDVEFEDIPENLTNNIVYALGEGKKILETAVHGEGFAPFTAIVAGDQVLMEAYVADDADDAFNAAVDKVKSTEGAVSYAFCYDGFVETEAGERDVVICEGALPGEETGFAIALPYRTSGDPDKGELAFNFDKELIFLGEAPNFFTE